MPICHNRAMKRFFLLCTLFLTACRGSPKSWEEAPLVTIQTVDKNGFSETVSNRDRLANFEKVDFLQSQPYQKVMRVFSRDEKGKSHAVITTYHSNGLVWQYLEISDGRANGFYREWHTNGTLKIELRVIEGVADLSEAAQMSWVFDGTSRVYDEEGRLKAEFPYQKGLLVGTATYYHPNGKIATIAPYRNNGLDGELLSYDEKGNLIVRTFYKEAKEHGSSEGYWENQTPRFIETCQDGKLLQGSYFSPEGILISSIEKGNGIKSIFEGKKVSMNVTYALGEPLGLVQLFRPDGSVKTAYHVRNGQKHGEECEYYPLGDTKEPAPKMKVQWHWDSITETKTWYENGVQASQRAYHNNKKHGLCLSWYRDASPMSIEEYDQDRLTKGSYFEKGMSKLPISQVINGTGQAILYDADGHLLHKVTYEKGRPLLQP